MRRFLQSLITRPASTLGGRPADIIERAFPLAGLAVQAIGRIGRLYLLADSFVYTGRAERNARPAEFGGALPLTDITV